MSTRILTDDGSEMRKHVGCMTGIFQLLDRRHFLTGQRVGGRRHNSKTLLITDGGQHNMEPGSVTKMKMEKTLQKQMAPDHQSSKIYPSSPSSSNLSLLRGRHKTDAQSEFPETPLSMKQNNSSSSSSMPSPDLQEVVKESMYREARSLSVKAVAKVDGKVHLLKRIDSPRSLNQSNSRKPFDGSMRGPNKFQQAPSYSYSNSYSAVEKDNHVLVRAAKNPARFSCDGMESREKLKANTMKIKDFPRLSLDSGLLRSIRSSASESRSNFLLGDAQELGTHKRSSSVVAKLMGLEGFPTDSVPINEDEHFQFAFPTDSATSIKKSTLKSRLPLELAPWCQSSDFNRARNPRVMRSKEASFNTPRVFSSVFGEIEKRITELEFRKSGKDLRALKQILEAMQNTRPRLECQTYHVCYDQSPRLPTQQQNRQFSTKWESYPTKKFNSSTPVVQQDKHNGNTKVATSHVYERGDSVGKGRTQLAPRKNNVNKEPSQCVPSVVKKINGRTPKSVQSPKTHGAVSPRLQEKKQGNDKQSHLNIPLPELNRVRKHQNKQSKPCPPSRRHNMKSNNKQHNEEQLSETSSDTRNTSFVSYMEQEVTSRNHAAAVEAKQQKDTKEMNPADRLDTATAMTEQPSPVSVLDAAFYIEDSPSPMKKISVAFRDYEPADTNEAEWHTEDLDYLPVNNKNLGSECNHEKLENIQHLVHKLSILSPNHEDNQIASLCQSDNIDHQYINKIILASGLLKDLDCVSTSTELYPSGHLINPELFEVLEQTENITRLSNEEPAEKNPSQKIHRKILFDTVNEILVDKLDSKGSLMPRTRCLSGQQILKELYTEIDYLQAKSSSSGSLVIEDDELVSILNADMKHESEDWAEHHCEIPALVLRIERLIFKDLITEVIRGDGEQRSRSHCRQLFTKH